MADNVTLNAGAGGAVIATDDIGSVHYPISKLAFGALDSVTLVSSSNPLPSTDADVKASVQVMDDWDETDRCKVNLIASQAGITGGAGAVAANTPRFTLASDDPAVASLAILDDWDETDRCKVNLIASQAGVTGGAGTVAANTPRVTLASDDPAVASLSVLDDWDDGDAAKVRLDPKTAGGLTIHRTISAASTNATSVKASAGQLYGYAVFNNNASARYLKLYNKASAPTVGTDTPVITLMIPGSSGLNLSLEHGIAFATGIAFALTTGIADSDTGAVAASEIAVNLFYK